MFSRLRVLELGEPIYSIVLQYSSSSFLREILFFWEALRFFSPLGPDTCDPLIVRTPEFIERDEGACTPAAERAAVMLGIPDTLWMLLLKNC
jgi:hypothetical protein